MIAAPSPRWVVRFDDSRTVFLDFEDAKTNLLDELWWYAQDVRDGDPELGDLLLNAWTEVSQIARYKNRDYYSYEIRDTTYHLCRLGREDEFIQ